jgi:hypothetical protein
MKNGDYEGFKNSSDLSELRDSRGVQRTESLFVEVSQTKDKYEPLYSLKSWNSRGYPSAYLIYMGCVDETEAALKLVGSLSHWRKLCKLRWFLKGRPEHGFEGLESWRQDMADRDASEAKRVILQECRNGNVTAARALDKLAKDSSKSIPKPTTSKKEEKEDSVITNLLDRHK